MTPAISPLYNHHPSIGSCHQIPFLPRSPRPPLLIPIPPARSLLDRSLATYLAMCSLIAPRAAAPGLGAAAVFLDRRRGVAAVAPSTRHRVGAELLPAAPSQKRGREDVDAAPSALRVRMDKELVALQGLVKRAKLLPRSRSAPPAENKYAPAPRRSEAPAVSTPSAAKRSTASQSKAATVVAHVPAKQQQRPVQRAAAAKTEVLMKKRRPEEEKELLARAAAREEFRRMLMEMEKAALPDETIYPEDLQELGIVFEHVVTRTRKEAGMAGRSSEADVEFVGV